MLLVKKQVATTLPKLNFTLSFHQLVVVEVLMQRCLIEHSSSNHRIDNLRGTTATTWDEQDNWGNFSRLRQLLSGVVGSGPGVGRREVGTQEIVSFFSGLGKGKGKDQELFSQSVEPKQAGFGEARFRTTQEERDTLWKEGNRRQLNFVKAVPT